MSRLLLAGENKERVFAAETRVHVAPMTEDEIQAYVDSDEPMDKAGAYGIQGRLPALSRGLRASTAMWSACRSRLCARHTRSLCASMREAKKNRGKQRTDFMRSLSFFLSRFPQWTSV